MKPSEKIPQKLEEKGVDILIATTKENVFYTAGLKIFTQWDGLSSAAYCIWTVEGGPYLIYPAINTGQVYLSETDFEGLASVHHNFYTKGAEMCDTDEKIFRVNQEVQNFDTPLEALLDQLESLNYSGSTVAVEMAGIRPDVVESIAETVSASDVVEADMLLAELRMVKSDDEVARLRRSAEITEQSVEETLEHLEPGMTEQEFTRLMQKKMVDKGATKVGHQHVAFGARGAHLGIVPYREYGTDWHRELEEGDVIQIDTGCIYEGYASDLARTYCYKRPTDDLEAKYEMVRATNDKTISLLRDGATNDEVYEASSRFIKKKGTEAGIPQVTGNDGPGHDIDLFGHSIGIKVLEIPAILPASDTYPAMPIKKGMVISVESPYKEVGTGLIATEDTVVVREDGAKRLTTAPETLSVVG